MITKIRGWIDRDTLSMFVEAQEYSEMSTMHIYTFPELKDDICIEMTILGKLISLNVLAAGGGGEPHRPLPGKRG